MMPWSVMLLLATILLMTIELAVATLNTRGYPRHRRRGLSRRRGGLWRCGSQDGGLCWSATHNPSSKTCLLSSQLRHRH
jgi:hypothetical protein